jgi:hypothetical protein
MPRRGATGLFEVENVDQPIVRIAVQPQRVVERLVENSHRLDMRIGRQLLVAKHQDLVPPEVLPERGRGGLVDTVSQVDTDNLGAENRADRHECIRRAVDGRHDTMVGLVALDVEWF